jgi:hypothetical protein
MTEEPPSNSVPDSNRLASEADESRRQVLRFIELFSDAFDELHGAVLRQINTGEYVSVHHDYPIMSIRENGFPGLRRRAFSMIAVRSTM